jgi:hypothetical protein
MLMSGLGTLAIKTAKKRLLRMDFIEGGWGDILHDI